jgi:flagellar motor switch protein FliN/FliY
MSETEENGQDAGKQPEAAAEQAAEPSSESNINQDVIRAIPITLSVEVGKTRLKLRDLMRLSQGSVLELDRGVGEPMEVKINDTVIAKGEIVSVGDKLGISVTDIVAPLERVKPA